MKTKLIVLLLMLAVTAFSDQTINFSITVSDSVYAEIESEAAARKISVSDYAGKVCLNALATNTVSATTEKRVVEFKKLTIDQQKAAICAGKKADPVESVK